MAIYQTYINMMNAKIRKQYKVSNPFVFKHISYLKNMEHFDDVGPCVMMASPGMLQVNIYIYSYKFILNINIFVIVYY